MKTYINYFNILLILLLSACSDRDWDEQPVSSSEEPVTLFTELPTWGATTRAYEDIVLPEKEKFAEGDVIQVQGIFTLKGGGSPIRRYDYYQYDGEKWVASNDTKLRWPLDADKGTFTAYYVAGMTGSLSGITDGKFDGELGGNHLLNDPLKAVATDVPYGYAVNFKFEHLCTRLILLNTKNNYAEEYWFRKMQGNEIDPGFANAYQLTYTEANGLDLSFCSNAETNQGTISTTKVMASNAGTAANAGYVVLYMQPGQYKGSELNYSGNRLYLSLNVDVLNTPVQGEDGLQAGKSYILDIEKANGIIDQEDSEDPWDPSDPEKDFDIQEFLNAIAKGESYQDILIRDNAGNMVLTKNLDFQGEEFNPVDLSTNITFDGNYHYIANTIHSLFFHSEGIVRNLELRNVKIEKFANDDATRAGALIRQNFGDIDNIRLRNIYIKLPGQKGTDRTLNIGGLVGEHSNGKISNICVIGEQSITIEDKVGIDGFLFLGGIVGQATGGDRAYIKNVSMLENPTITITLKSNGQSTAAVGGVVGATTIHLENCSYNATIDCSQATVLGCGVGGLFGRELSDDKTPVSYTIQNCQVSGRVYGPFCHSLFVGTKESQGRSSVGGIGGGVQGKDVTFDNCNTFCDVYDCFSSSNSYSTTGLTSEIFATGGAFGRFTSGNAKGQVFSCTAWGKVNAQEIGEGAGKKAYIGSFIGYTKAGYEDSDLNQGANKVNSSVNGALPACGGMFAGDN